MPTPQPSGLIARLRAIVVRLQTAITEPLPNEYPAATIAMSAWLWLDRVAEGVARLVARIQAGTIRPPRPPHPRPTPSRPGDRGFPLPRRPAWLLEKLPEPEAVVTETQAWLATPELQPLLAQQPARFARLLRPLCRALNIPPPDPLRPAAPAVGSAKPTEPDHPDAERPKPTKPHHPSAEIDPPEAPSNLIRLAPKASTLSRRAELALGAFPLPPKIA